MSLLGFDFDVPKVDMDKDEVNANLGVHVTYKPSLYLQMLRQLEAFSHFNALQQIFTVIHSWCAQTDLGKLDSGTQLPGPPLNIHLPKFCRRCHGNAIFQLTVARVWHHLHLLLSILPPIHVSYVGADNELFYAAPESAGPSQFSPYSSLYRASASGSTPLGVNMKMHSVPGRILETSRPWNELAIIRITFLKGHIYKMRRWDNIVSETMISVYLEQSMEFLGAIPQTLRTSTSFHRLTAVIHLIMIEFQTDDPDVVKCVKQEVPFSAATIAQPSKITCMQTVFMA